MFILCSLLIAHRLCHYSCFLSIDGVILCSSISFSQNRLKSQTQSTHCMCLELLQSLQSCAKLNEKYQLKKIYSSMLLSCTAYNLYMIPITFRIFIDSMFNIAMLFSNFFSLQLTLSCKVNLFLVYMYVAQCMEYVRDFILFFFFALQQNAKNAIQYLIYNKQLLVVRIRRQIVKKRFSIDFHFSNGWKFGATKWEFQIFAHKKLLL